MTPQTRRDFTSRHDHVGSMRYGTGTLFDLAVCVECGQRWELTRTGWSPVPPWIDDPPGLDTVKQSNTNQPGGNTP